VESDTGNHGEVEMNGPYRRMRLGTDRISVHSGNFFDGNIVYSSFEFISMGGE